MRVFITGATGFIGSALVPDLIKAGHQVLGLTRSDSGAQALAAAGAQAHHGDLENLDSLRSGAAAADAVIHLAFNHDFSQFVKNCETDLQAIKAMGSVLAGSNKPFIVTSGTAMAQAAAPGTPSTENDPTLSPQVFPRAASEQAVAALTARGVRTAIVRLPQVHDTEKQGLVTYAIQVAREKGVVAYIGEGKNRWPAAHRFAAAHLYHLALEKGSAGDIFHAVDEEGVSAQDIAEALARGLKMPTVSLKPEEAANHFGWLAHFVAMDIPSSSALTRKKLGWTPTGPGLIEDLNNMRY